MITERWPAEQCPKCLHANSMDLSTGERICLNCSHEWDPATTTGPLAATPFTMMVPDSPKLVAVPARTDDGGSGGGGSGSTSPTPPVDPEKSFDLALQIERARAAFVGKRVVYHDVPAEGVVSAVSDDGLATIDFGSGYSVEATPDEFSVVPEPEDDDATLIAMSHVALTVAAQCIRAAATAIVDGDDGRIIGLAPGSWMVDDPAGLLLNEHGAAYATAMVAIAGGVPTDKLLTIAAMVDEAATAAQEGKNP